MSEATPLKGSCHCGATRFEVTAPPQDITRCNCTFCSKRGVLWAYYPPEQVKFTSRDQAGVYDRNAPVVHHHCQKCGCGTWSDIPVWENNAPVPGQFKVGLNARLFDDFNLDAVRVKFVDGRNLW
ncbi:GFA family protein [Corallococcus exiguus]|uniref:GFA family protein n=1 Tax=Corallococcus exiguus TaxID=83462 RepID=A0A7X5BTE1_9BACT|nr:GFA family protein [Corallococcus exiguus]NBC41143.1 GFA family protein [Corallococcus exiguus]TNV64560.1 GFA family protein [Corallococcus exiguus]